MSNNKVQPEPQDVESQPRATKTQAAMLELIEGIPDPVWKPAAKMLLAEHGVKEAEKRIKERFVADASLWSVVAALFCTIGVAFFLLGPSNFSEENDEKANNAVAYLYVAFSVLTIMANTAAVTIGGTTYALCLHVPEQHFVEWVRYLRRNPALNVSVYVQAGVFALAGCVVTLAYLMHGWKKCVLTSAICFVLFVGERLFTLKLFVDWLSFMEARMAAA